MAKTQVKTGNPFLDGNFGELMDFSKMAVQVGSIVCGLARDPVMGLCGLASLARSMACMLEAADLSASGLRGIVRIKALSAIYLATLRVWLRDESPDLSRTMASLDRHLRRAEWLAERCSQLRHKDDEEAPAAA